MRVQPMSVMDSLSLYGESIFTVGPRTAHRVIGGAGEGTVSVWEREIGGERYRFGAGPDVVTVAWWRRSRQRWEAVRAFPRG